MLSQYIAAAQMETVKQHLAGRSSICLFLHVNSQKVVASLLDLKCTVLRFLLPFFSCDFPVIKKLQVDTPVYYKWPIIKLSVGSIVKESRISFRVWNSKDLHWAELKAQRNMATHFTHRLLATQTVLHYIFLLLTVDFCKWIYCMN